MSNPGSSTIKIEPVEVEEKPEAGHSDTDDEVSVDGMDEATRQTLSGIDQCQKELDEFNEKASDEIIQVETKYNKLRKPCYEKRAAMIEKMPNFWVNAIMNHPQISMIVEEEEEDCLHFLKQVEVETEEKLENGFKIKFIFNENPFFHNLELVKKFELGPDVEAKSISTTINWMEGMDLSKKQPQIIANRKKKGLEPNTFFSWFSDNKDPWGDDMAEVFKDDLWPNPLQYYLTPDMEDEDDTDEDSWDFDEDDSDGEDWGWSEDDSDGALDEEDDEEDVVEEEGYISDDEEEGEVEEEGYISDDDDGNSENGDDGAEDGKGVEEDDNKAAYSADNDGIEVQAVEGQSLDAGDGEANLVVRDDGEGNSEEPNGQPHSLEVGNGEEEKEK